MIIKLRYDWTKACAGRKAWKAFHDEFLTRGGLHNASNPLGAVHDPLVLLFKWESQKLIQSHVAGDLKGAAWRTLFHPQGFLMSVCGGSSDGHLAFWKPDKNTESTNSHFPASPAT